MIPPKLRRQVLQENDGKNCQENFYLNPGDLERLEREDQLPRVERAPIPAGNTGRAEKRRATKNKK